MGKSLGDTLLESSEGARPAPATTLGDQLLAEDAPKSLGDALLAGEDPSVTTAKRQHGIRDMKNAANGARNIGAAAKAFDPGLVGEARRQLQTDSQTREQLAGGRPAPSPMPKTTGTGEEEHRGLGGFLEKYAMAPFRAAGSLHENVTKYAEQNELHRGLARAQRAAGKEPFDPNILLPQAAEAALNPDAPTLFETVHDQWEREGEVQQRSRLGAAASQIADNLGKHPALKIPGAILRGIDEAHPIDAAREALSRGNGQEAGLRFAGEIGKGLLGGAWEGAKAAGTALKGGEHPLDELAANNAAVGQKWDAPGEAKLKLGLTPGQATAATGLAATVLDPTPAVLGVVGKGLGLAAKGGANAFEQGLLRARRASPAIEAATQAVRPKLDALAFGIRGAPARFEAVARDAREAGFTGPAPSDMSRAFQQVDPRTNIGMEGVASAVDALKVIPLAGEADFHLAIVMEGTPEGAAALQRLRALTPAADKAVLEAQTLLAKQGGKGAEFANLPLRKNYLPGELSEEARLSRRPVAKDPAKLVQGAPGVGGFHAEKALVDELNAEMQQVAPGSPLLRTDVEANALIRAEMARPGGPRLPKVKALAAEFPSLEGGGALMEENPAKLVAKRGIAGAKENSWAEFLSGNAKPYAVPMQPGQVVPKGYVMLEPHKVPGLVNQVLGHQPLAVPAPLAEFLAKATVDPKSSGLLSKVLGAWKWTVTAGAGPAYHARNNLYSAVKLYDRFGPGAAASLGDATAVMAGEGKNLILGKTPLQIQDLAAEFGTARGTGGAPFQKAAEIKRAAGLQRDVMLGPLRQLGKLPGAAAEKSDEFWRIASAIEEAKRNGGDWTKAFDFADRFITHTRNVGPVFEGLTSLMPFVRFPAKELPGAIKSFALGEAKSPYVAKNVAETIAPKSTQIPEAKQSDRSIEQASLPMGFKDAAGNPVYMGQPASFTAVASSFLDAPYRAIAGIVKGGESPGSVAKSAFRGALQQTRPDVSIPLQAGLGQRAITNQPLDREQIASPWEVVAAKAGRAPWVTILDMQGNPTTADAPDARFFSTGMSALGVSAIPYPALAKMANAPTDEERAYAATRFFGGVPLSPQDPSFEATGQRLELTNRIAAARAAWKKRHGVP